MIEQTFIENIFFRLMHSIWNFYGNIFSREMYEISKINRFDFRCNFFKEIPLKPVNGRMESFPFVLNVCTCVCSDVLRAYKTAPVTSSALRRGRPA